MKEVRELVADMRATKLEDEVIRIQQMLKAAEMDFTMEGDPAFTNIPTIVENVLSMCLKEAVTNVVKHSYGTACYVSFEQLPNEFVITVKDNGIGITRGGETSPGNGLKGMRERLEFVNGSLRIEGGKGTNVTIRVPAVTNKYNGGD